MTSFGDPPNFLIKTALGCSLVIILIVLPFTVIDFIQGHYLIAVATCVVNLACGLNIWYGIRGKYSLPVNTYLVAPSGCFTVIAGLYILADAGSYWPLLLAVAYYFVLPERRAWFFNVVTVLITVPIAWSVLEASSAIRFTAVMIGVSLFAFLSIREINILHEMLNRQAVTDKLTGLFNRSLLEHSLQQAIGRHQRSGAPMTLISFDIDRFKAINDTQGHDVGDRVLSGLGELLHKRTRSSDMVFRAGGEEFILLLHDTEESRGAKVAETLRKEVKRATLLPDGQVTISVGVSGLQPGMEVADWLKVCDEKLYRAKEEGRNRVVC